MKKLLVLFLIFPFLSGCISYKNSNFSIKFVVDKNWDMQSIYSMFRSDGGFAGLAARAKHMCIEYDFAKMIHDSNDFSEIKESLEILVNNRYQEIGNGLKQSVKDYSLAWESIINEFSDIVIELTQHEWFYDNYVCVVSAFHIGLSNWYGNKVTRLYGVDPIEQRGITAFEIVLSHVFHISRKYYNIEDVPDHVIWGISEITAMLILEDNRLMKLWGNNYTPSVSGYHQLAELERKLRNAYSENEGFLNYLHTAINLAMEMNTDFSKSLIPETNAAFFITNSIPEEVIQLIPTAIGWGNINDGLLNVNLFEPLNFQDRGGWWTFSNSRWAGNSEYYIFYIPMQWSDDGSFFRWVLNETLIYVGNGTDPIKTKIESTSISYSLEQFKMF